MLNIIVYCT